MSYLKLWKVHWPDKREWLYFTLPTIFSYSEHHNMFKVFFSTPLSPSKAVVHIFCRFIYGSVFASDSLRSNSHCNTFHWTGIQFSFGVLCSNFLHWVCLSPSSSCNIRCRPIYEMPMITPQYCTFHIGLVQLLQWLSGRKLQSCRIMWCLACSNREKY